MEIRALMQTQAKALADPSRFRIFQFIAESTEPVAVAELTELLGFNHNAIRQHLAILVETGIVTESTENRTIRGRPRNQYALRADALSAFESLSGSHARVAELLLEVIDSGESPFEVGYRAGRSARTHDASAPSITDALERLLQQLAVDGFEPSQASESTIELHNCPFADLASKNPAIVCELHRGLINGNLSDNDGTYDGSLEPHDPKRAGCLVGVRARPVGD